QFGQRFVSHRDEALVKLVKIKPVAHGASKPAEPQRNRIDSCIEIQSAGEGKAKRKRGEASQRAEWGMAEGRENFLNPACLTGGFSRKKLSIEKMIDAPPATHDARNGQGDKRPFHDARSFMGMRGGFGTGFAAKGHVNQ